MLAFGSTWSSLADALRSTPDWVVAAALLVIAAIVALIVHRAMFVAFRRAFGERHPFLHRIVLRVKGPLALALIAFALATSVLGKNQLQFSGNLGYASQSGVPSAGFRASYKIGRAHV